MRFRSISLGLALAAALGAGACSTLVRAAAGPPHARARQPKLALDGQGQAAGVALAVDLYNPNPVELGATRFDFRLEAGGETMTGSVNVDGDLPQHEWQSVPIYVPLERGSGVHRAIMAGEPYVVTGSLVLVGGMKGLAVGVSGEGVIADNSKAVLHVAGRVPELGGAR